jgi:hypothetical protein
MSAIFSNIRTAHIVALTAVALSALTVGASAGGYHGSQHPTPLPPDSGYHGSQHPTPVPPPVPAVKSSYDPATSIIRDHRNRSAGNGTTSVPNGGQPK